MYDPLRELDRMNREQKERSYEFFASEGVASHVHTLTEDLRADAGTDASVRMSQSDRNYVAKLEQRFTPEESARSEYAEYLLTEALEYNPEAYKDKALVTVPANKYDDYVNGADLITWAGAVATETPPPHCN
jgi:hypothetical protein